MRKRIDMLDELKKCLEHTSDPPESSELDSLAHVKELFVILENYYELKDLEMGTSHHGIFEMLYIHETTYSFDGIAIEKSITPQTLSRYRANYNEFAKKVIPSLKEKSNIIQQKLLDRI